MHLSRSYTSNKYASGMHTPDAARHTRDLKWMLELKFQHELQRAWTTLLIQSRQIS
jgi:hypothetical protein